MSLDRLLLDSLSTPLFLVDASGTVHFANAAAGDFWRQLPERLEGQTLTALFGEMEELAGQLARVCAEQSTVTIDHLALRQGGGLPPLPLRVQLDPVLRGSEPVQQVLMSFWDQTHLEALRRAEQEQHRLGAIAGMVRRLAHELQNPLSGVKGAAQLLARQTAGQPALQEFTGVILKELGRLERLVKDLLMNGGEPPLQWRLFNVHELLDEVIWFHSNAGVRVRFERDYDPSLPDLCGDRDRLHQVFLNLIQNGVDACPEGQPLVLRTRIGGPWNAPEGLPAPAQAHFLIDVEDQGAGVPEQVREHLFTPFFTTKKQGTGLGLSICYRIVHAHGGRLVYKPGREKGSIFTVILPLNGRCRDSS